MRMVPTVSFDDIENELELSYEAFNFLDEVENDSYVYLALDEDHIQNLEDDIELSAKWGYSEKVVQGYKNELKLVKHFNDLGYHNCILIYVSW